MALLQYSSRSSSAGITAACVAFRGCSVASFVTSAPRAQLGLLKREKESVVLSFDNSTLTDEELHRRWAVVIKRVIPLERPPTRNDDQHMFFSMANKCGADPHIDAYRFPLASPHTLPLVIRWALYLVSCKNCQPASSPAYPFPCAVGHWLMGLHFRKKEAGNRKRIAPPPFWCRIVGPMNTRPEKGIKGGSLMSPCKCKDRKERKEGGHWLVYSLIIFGQLHIRYLSSVLYCCLCPVRVCGGKFEEGVGLWKCFQWMISPRNSSTFSQLNLFRCCPFSSSMNGQNWETSLHFLRIALCRVEDRAASRYTSV